MPHDQHARGVAHQLSQGVGHDAGLDLRALFDLETAAAEEFKVQPVLDDHLIAAAGQREVHRHIRKLQALGQGRGVLSQTDADRGADPVGALHLVHLLRDGELVPLHLFQILLLEHDQIAVAVVAAQDRVVAAAPVVQQILHRVADLVLDALVVVAAHLVEIVNDDDRRDGTGVLVAQADIVVLGDVDPIGDAHEGRIFGRAFRTDQVAVQLVLSPAQLHETGILALSLHQPLARKVRQKVHHAQIHARALFAEEHEEHLVAPDNAAVVQAEHRDGERKMKQGAVLGVFRVIGDGLDVGGELLFLHAPRDQRIDQQNGKHRSLRRSEIIQLEIERRRGKSGQEKQVDPDPRLSQALDAFVVVHGTPPERIAGISNVSIYYTKFSLPLQ